MAPIEEIFAREYPDYEPFGQVTWLMTLVRGIPLAEPIAGDFGRCFADVTSCRVGRRARRILRAGSCVVRERLADILQATVRRPPPAA
jgi:endoglucanase